MRFAFILFFIVSLSQALTIEGFAKQQHYYRDYDKALAHAKAVGKPMMLVMVSRTCGWCRLMERKTLSDATVNTKVHEAFVPIILERDLDTYPDIFKTPFVPVTFFIDTKQVDEYWEMRGYKDVEGFLEQILISLEELAAF